MDDDPGAGAPTASTPIPSRVIPAAATTLTVVAAAEFAVIVCDRNPTAAWSATVTTGGVENAAPADTRIHPGGTGCAGSGVSG